VTLPRRKKPNVVIVGFSRPDLNEAALFSDIYASYELWGLNSLFVMLEDRHFDRWFEIHDRKYLEGVEGAAWDKHIRWLRGERRIPIYMQRTWPDIPMSRKFPRAAVEKLTPRGWYHCSSVDWMVAMAIGMKFKRIHIQGINFGPEDGGEPFSARACLEYWLGVAEGRGIETYVQGGGMFHAHTIVKSRAQYGYDVDFRNVRTEE
jgi:hypothetical protein